jgi:hypothetical protein
VILQPIFSQRLRLAEVSFDPSRHWLQLELDEQLTHFSPATIADPDTRNVMPKIIIIVFIVVSYILFFTTIFYICHKYLLPVASPSRYICLTRVKTTSTGDDAVGNGEPGICTSCPVVESTANTLTLRLELFVIMRNFSFGDNAAPWGFD